MVVKQKPEKFKKIFSIACPTFETKTSSRLQRLGGAKRIAAKNKNVQKALLASCGGVHGCYNNKGHCYMFKKIKI